MTNSKFSVVLLSLILLLFAASSCNKNKETVSISLKPTFGQEELKLNTWYPTNNGDSLSFSKLKLFLSEIALIDKDGKKTTLKDIALFSLVQGEPINLTTISDEIKSGNYTSVSFNFGVTTEQNNTDPASVSCPNPLCADNDMWWSSTLKYTHVKLEGQSKLSPSFSPNTTFLYHVGTSDNFRSYTFEKEITVSEGKATELTIQLDLKSLLSNFDMASENVTHTDDYPLVSTKFANQFQSAITIL